MGTRAQVLRTEADGASWEVARRPLAPLLRPYVRECVGYVERSAAPLRRREFPGSRIVVILELGPPIDVYGPDEAAPAARFGSGFVAGLHERYAMTEHQGVQAGVQLDLTPIGARLLFGLPMRELTGQVVELDELMPKRWRGLSTRLGELATWDERFDLLERVLEHSLAREPGARTRAATSTAISTVAWAMQRIESSGGTVDIETLTRELGYSRKHVIGLFHEHVGMPPKLLARIVRFNRLLERVRAGEKKPWSELALELGYYDQAHLVRDVKQFTGSPPSQLPRPFGG